MTVADMTIMDGLTAILLFLGVCLSLAGGIGLHRFTDFYARLHANGVTDTLCTLMFLLALACQYGFSLATGKLFLIFFFLFFTSPTASYALGHNAWIWGLKPKAELITKEQP